MSQNVTRGWPIRSLALHESREHQKRQREVSEVLDKTEANRGTSSNLSQRYPYL